MAWDNAVVTNQGILLLQQVLEGQTLVLDSAAGGTGTVNPSALMTQTALKEQKQTFPVVGSTSVNNGKKIDIQITNKDLAAGYPLQQIGLWAHIDTGTPILFAILQDSTGIPVPSETELSDFVMSFYAVIDFSNEAEFQVIVDPSSLVTFGAMTDAITAAVSLKQDKIAEAGILKGDGNGNIMAAAPGVDFGYPQQSGPGDPTSATPGMIGQRYLNTATGREFICTAASAGSYTWTSAGANDAANILTHQINSG